jgi:hypothetical protein
MVMSPIEVVDVVTVAIIATIITLSSKMFVTRVTDRSSRQTVTVTTLVEL